MDLTQSHSPFVVVGSVLIALLLSVFPITGSLAWWRPEFVALVVIYWVMAQPQHFGVAMAWGVGLVQDVIHGAVIGEHAIALALVAYFCLAAYRRILNYSAWQQAGWVFVLVGVHQLVCNWVHALSGHAAPSLIFLLPALVTGLLWPFCWVLLESLRLRFRH